MTVVDDNIGGAVVSTGFTVVVMGFIRDTFINMVPFMLLAVALILVDLYFGIGAARARGEAVRPSRAVRRTVGKAMEYLCWVSISASLAVAFGVRWPEWVLLGLVTGNEVLSMVTNWLEMHGKRLRGLNVFEIVGKKTGLDLKNITIENISDSGDDGTGKMEDDGK